MLNYVIDERTENSHKLGRNWSIVVLKHHHLWTLHWTFFFFKLKHFVVKETFSDDYIIINLILTTSLFREFMKMSYFFYRHPRAKQSFHPHFSFYLWNTECIVEFKNNSTNQLHIHLCTIECGLMETLFLYLKLINIGTLCSAHSS